MTNQVNQAFEKWWHSSKYMQVVFSDNRTKRVALDGYEASSQASEIEINALKERVAELQSHLSSQSIEIANNDVTLEAYAHKIAELQADNNRLREALGELLPAYRKAVKLYDSNHDDAYTVKAHNVLAKTRSIK